jgi:peroxiredoxin
MHYFLTTLLLTLALCLQSVPTATAQRVRPDAKLTVGQKAPDFNLKGVDGKQYTLASFAGKDILVFIFTANHCPTAQAYEGRMEQLHADYSNKGVQVIAVSPNDPLAIRLDELGWTDIGDHYEEMQYRAEQRGWEFPYLYDGDTQAMSRKYDPVSTPHAYVFDKSRTLRFVGRIDDNEDPAKVKSHDTRNAIEALLAGKEPPVTSTKTFGCSIKWSDKRSSVQATFDKWAKEPVTIKTIDETGIKALVANDTRKLRLINMWATWCGPCVTEFPDLIEINRMYRKRPFEMITISADEPDQQAAALEFLQEQQASTINYIFNSDDKYAMIEALDPEWPGPLPYTILVEPGGNVLYRHLGEVDPMELKQVIVDWVGRFYHSPRGRGYK